MTKLLRSTTKKETKQIMVPLISAIKWVLHILHLKTFSTFNYEIFIHSLCLSSRSPSSGIQAHQAPIHPSIQPSFHLSIYYCFASFAIVLSHEIHHWIVAIMWRSSVCFCDAAFVLLFLSQSFMCFSVFKWRHLLKCSRTVVIKNGERKHYIFVFEEHTGKRQNGNNNLLPNTLLKQFFSSSKFVTMLTNNLFGMAHHFVWGL